MGLYRELCFVLMGTLLFSILLLYESKKLDDYEFPVYSTEFCPRNQTEWNDRSSAISCNESNGYMCLPNTERTQLLEFCYDKPFLWMEKDKCFYLIKKHLRVNDYKCQQFRYGCPNSSYMSSKIFEYQSCVTIGDGCYIAEPSCNRDSTEHNNKPDWILPVTIILGIVIVHLPICLIGIYYRKGLKRRRQEGNENDELEASGSGSDTHSAQGHAAIKTSSRVEDEYNENSPLIKGQDQTEVIENGTDTDSTQGHAAIKTSSRVEDEYDENSPLIKGQDQTEVIENGTDTDSTQVHAAIKTSSRVEDEYDENSPSIKGQDQTEVIENGTDTDSTQGHASCNRNSYVEDHTNDEHRLPMQQNHSLEFKSTEKESQLDRNILENWQQDDKLFVSTKACEKVENLIKEQNLVIVVGHSGSGKSAIIKHIALEFRNRNWVVKSVNKVTAIVKAFSKNNVEDNKTLFVLDDPIGTGSYDEILYRDWKTNEEHLKACLKKIRVLLSCRKCVQMDKRVKGLLKNESNIVDIDADDCKLRDDEKLKIWNKYKSDNISFKIDLTEIMKIDAYFPLLCKLFFSNEENKKKGFQFFEEPVEIYEDEIEYFKTSSKEKYCALVLLVLFSNELCVSDLLHKENSKQMYKSALQLCGMEDCTPTSTICDALETLKGFYVTKIGDNYQFCHDFVMEVTSYVFGRYYPKDMIEYADITFLRKRVKVKGCDDQNDQFTIFLSDTHLDLLGERLLKEIFGEKIFDVVMNPCLKVKKVVDAMINRIEMHKEKIDLLLVKKEITLEKQTFNPESEDLRFTKLDFVSLEYNLSPLCALIIFGHTDLSLHCLQALQQWSINFKDSSVFLAVCCNGAINLFNMFSKEDTETYLTEKWGDLHPIHIVSVFHNYEILKNLFKHKVDVNQRDSIGHTALMFAVYSNTEMSERQNQTLQVLLSHGADINLSDLFGNSPLHIACRYGQDSTVQLLLSHGADINLCDKEGNSLLYIACRSGQDSTVQLLLSHGADINLCDKDGYSPLLIACLCKRYSTVKLLLSHEADINLCNKCGNSPLQIACRSEHNEIEQLLLSHEADINLCNKCGNSPPYIACRNGQDSTVQLLLSHGADINLCDKNGISPLYIACLYKRYSTVKLLLGHEADINLCDKNGRSPLYIACRNGQDSIVQLLLSHGADINLCNEYGNSPLYIACRYGHNSTVQLLLNSKADTNLNKKNPVLFAFYMRQHAIIKTLLDAGVNTSVVNYCGLKYVSSDWCDNDDITGQYLLRKDNIVDNMYDLDSFFSLFVFCQVEELTREYNDHYRLN